MQNAPASVQPFDIDAWYAEMEPKCRYNVHPTKLLLSHLRKDTSNWAARTIYSKNHPSYRKPNKGLSAETVWCGGKYPWLQRLEKHNKIGRRVYFTVNEGGTEWSDIKSCPAHFFEYDDLPISEYLARDWSTFKEIGFFRPSADVYSGNKSPHGYFYLKAPYTNVYRWAINQIRLNHLLGTDPAIFDGPRIMRAPGFHHTDDEGNPVRKSLLLRSEPELRYSIEEFEAKLLEHELAQGVSVLDLLDEKSLCFDPEHRDGTISGLVEIFGPDIADEFERHFEARVTGTEHFLDARSIEEIHASFALIPAYEPGNGTYNGENPVTTADGREVKIRYFSLLAGLRACFLQARKTEQDCIDFVSDRWDHLDSGYIAQQIRGASGSVRSRTYWWFAEQCGYQLQKVKTKTVTNADGKKVKVAQPQGLIKPLSVRIQEAFDKLYKVMGSYEDTFNEREALMAELYDLGVRREVITERLLEMLEKEFGEKVGFAEVPREALPSTHTTTPPEDLIPGLVMLNRVAVLVGNYGTWKTTIATLIATCVIEGGTLPLMAGAVKHKGRVLFIASDGDAGAIPTVKQYARRCGKPLEKYGDRFLFYGADDNGQTSWSFCFRDLRKLNEDLLKYKETEEPIRLIVIDSFHAVMDLAGMDSGIGPMNGAMRLLGRICKRHGVSILILHHTLKSNEKVAGGHAAITQVADSVLFITKEDRKFQDLAIRKLEVRKHRNGMERDFFFTVQNEKGVVIAPSDTSADVENLILLEMWREREDGSSPRNLTQYLSDYDLSEKRVKSTLAKMRRPPENLVKVAANRWWLTDAGLKKARALAKKETEAMEHAGIREDASAEDFPFLGSDATHKTKPHREEMRAMEAEQKKEVEAEKKERPWEETEQHLADGFAEWAEPADEMEAIRRGAEDAQAIANYRAEVERRTEIADDGEVIIDVTDLAPDPQSNSAA